MHSSAGVEPSKDAGQYRDKGRRRAEVERLVAIIRVAFSVDESARVDDDVVRVFDLEDVSSIPRSPLVLEADVLEHQIRARVRAVFAACVEIKRRESTDDFLPGVRDALGVSSTRVEEARSKSRTRAVENEYLSRFPHWSPPISNIDFLAPSTNERLCPWPRTVLSRMPSSLIRGSAKLARRWIVIGAAFTSSEARQPAS